MATDWADEKADLLIIAGLTRRNIVAALREAHEQGRAEGQAWQPIETAPKDGKLILCTMMLLPDEWEIDRDYFSESVGWCRKWTHWQPLPPPPKEQP